MFLRFPKISQHPARMDHAILHGKPFSNPLFLGMFLEGEQTRNIFFQPSFLKVDKPGNVVSWPCFPKKKTGNISSLLYPGHPRNDNRELQQSTVAIHKPGICHGVGTDGRCQQNCAGRSTVDCTVFKIQQWDVS